MKMLNSDYPSTSNFIKIALPITKENRKSLRTEATKKVHIQKL